MTAPTGARRLLLFSLWYFPSHFGLHVDDLARAFADAGYDATIVTVSKPTFNLPYFDPFRDTFLEAGNGWHDVLRLNVERLEERGAYNPHLYLARDPAFDECRRRMEVAPGYLLHFFEMFVPYFNSETVGAARVTSLMYAGNFVRRIAAREFGEAARRGAARQIVNRLFDRSRSAQADGGYRLRGVECVFSETRALPPVLRATGLRTPAWWVSRPIFAAPVIAAARCDIHAELDIPRGAKILLYAGRAAKNARVLPRIRELVQSRRANDRILLLLIGARPEELAGWPGVAGSENCVKAVPLVDRSKLFGIMKSADVLVYPGLVDGYPKVISEAGLARLPVVAFNSPASGVREMQRNEDTALLVDVASPGGTSGAENERFAAAVDRILSDRRLRDGIVERAFISAQRMEARRFVERIERRWERCKRRPADC